MRVLFTRLSLLLVFFSVNICIAQQQFGSFLKHKQFQVTMDPNYNAVKLRGFCEAHGSLYAISWEGYLVKVDTSGTIVWTKHPGISSTKSGYNGAICFDQDTLWVEKLKKLHAVNLSGEKLGVTIDFSHLEEPYIGDIGGLIKDSNTFWLLEQWLPILYQMDRNGNIIKHYASSWLDFWSPTIAQWGNKILKVTDSHSPANIFNNLGVLAFDKATGDITDVWDIPKDFTGSTYLGISKGMEYLWAAQFDEIDEILTVHQLALPDVSPPPAMPSTAWGDFIIADWKYCPIMPAMIEGFYGFGHNQNTHEYWFGNGLYDMTGAKETESRYLGITHFSRPGAQYDIAVFADTLWCIHHWAGRYSASIAKKTVQDNELTTHASWDVDLKQAHGIATDGTYFWISGRDTMITLSGRSHHIVKYDRQGNLLAHFEYPDEDQHNYEDLTWHQGALWAITRSMPFDKTVTIQKIDHNDGHVLESYATGWVKPAQNVWANLASDGTHLLTIGTTSSGTFDWWENEHLRILKLKPAAVVPVELSAFSGFTQNNQVVLEWETTSECSNYGFEIERRTSTTEFSKIGFIKGAGTTSSRHIYQFIDNEVKPGHYYYRLRQIDHDGSVTYSRVISVASLMVCKYTLYQNYPNPFNPQTTLSYQLPKAGDVILKIYNLSGQETATLVNEFQSSGMHKITWQPQRLSSGIYFYKLQAGEFSEMKKLIYQK